MPTRTVVLVWLITGQIINKYFLIYFFASGGGFPLYPEILQYYTVQLDCPISSIPVCSGPVEDGAAAAVQRDHQAEGAHQGGRDGTLQTRGVRRRR